MEVGTYLLFSDPTDISAFKVFPCISKPKKDVFYHVIEMLLHIFYNCPESNVNVKSRVGPNLSWTDK